MTEQVEVTQADRELTQVVLGEMVLGNPERAERAVARHRIAAQAELLEALELFLDACDIAEDGPDESDLNLANKRLVEAKVKARAAIAKAKGEA